MNTHRARKRFGQHFLVDIGVIDAIVRSISSATTDTIVEIGPGLGAMTEPLARAAGELHLVELDRDLAAALRDRWADSPNVSVHEADALKFDFSTLGDELRVVGNLPYNISTPLLFHLLEQRAVIRDMHFMLQKEVVDRIAADPGSKAFGRLSVMLQAYLIAEALFDVPPDAFDPPPAVNSAIVRLYARPPGDPLPRNPDVLASTLASAFGKRRKTLRNALAGVAEPALLEELGIDPASRAETVSVDSWVKLADRLATDG